MTTYAWPTGPQYVPQSMTWGIAHNQRASTSPLSGYTQTSSVPSPRWLVSMTFSEQPWAWRRLLEAFLLKLSGMEHRVQLYDMGPSGSFGLPSGTINTSGVTLSSSAAQFATSLALTGCGASKTLLAGDKLSVGGQILANIDDTTASGGGTMTITVRPPLRAAASSGASVTLSKPVALFVLADPKLEFGRRGPTTDQLTVEFVEVFA